MVGLLDRIFGDDTTKDDMGQTEADRRAPIWGDLIKAGLLAVAGGGNLMPSERARYYAAAGGALGDIPSDVMGARSQAAQNTLRQQQIQAQKQTLAQTQAAQNYIRTPEFLQSLQGLTPAEQAIAMGAAMKGDYATIEKMTDPKRRQWQYKDGMWQSPDGKMAYDTYTQELIKFPTTGGPPTTVRSPPPPGVPTAPPGGPTPSPAPAPNAAPPSAPAGGPPIPGTPLPPPPGATAAPPAPVPAAPPAAAPPMPSPAMPPPTPPVTVPATPPAGAPAAAAAPPAAAPPLPPQGSGGPPASPADADAAARAAGYTPTPQGMNDKPLLKNWNQGEFDKLPPRMQNEVRAIAEYRTPMPGQTRGGQAGLTRPQIAAIQAAVQRVTGGTYDARLYPVMSKTMMDYAPGGKVGQNMLALDTAYGHLGHLYDLGIALKNGDVRAANDMKNRIATELGISSDPSAFQFVSNALADELARSITGHVTDAQIESWKKLLGQGASPENIHRVVMEAQALMQSREKAVTNAWNNTMKGMVPLPDFISGENRTKAKEIREHPIVGSKPSQGGPPPSDVEAEMRRRGMIK